MCEKIERIKLLSVKCHHITIPILDGDEVRHLIYKPNGKTKRSPSGALLYEYELQLDGCAEVNE